MTNRASASPSGPRPSVGRWLAPVLSIAGLLIIALVTLSLLNGDIPFVGTTKGGTIGSGGNGGGAVTATPAPSNVVVIPPEVVTFPGSIVYAKAGNIWVQSGKDARQLTTGGDDSMPSWSPDGTSIYFIRTADGFGRWPAGGVLREYQMTIPSIMQVKADGSGPPVRILNGKVTKSGRIWHAWIREPVLSPDGRTMAMVSDRPDPSQSDVVLQLYDLVTKKSKVPALGETPPQASCSARKVRGPSRSSQTMRSTQRRPIRSISAMTGRPLREPRTGWPGLGAGPGGKAAHRPWLTRTCSSWLGPSAVSSGVRLVPGGAANASPGVIRSRRSNSKSCPEGGERCLLRSGSGTQPSFQ
jgi:hypothetical protein